MNTTYAPIEPPRTEVDGLSGATLVEFGAPWCGHCKAAQPLLAEALGQVPQLDDASLHHLKIEDGSGKPLGRSFHVKLWPTFVFMRDGKELGRLVRPASTELIRQELERIAVPA